MEMLGSELPDDTEGLPATVMVFAGLGWFAGALLGLALAENVRAVGVAGRVLLRAGTGGIVICAAAIALWPVRSGWPETEVTFFSAWRDGGDGLASVIVALGGAALVVGTFIMVSRHHEVDRPRVPSRFAGGVGVAGLFVGGLSFALVMLAMTMSWSQGLNSEKTRAVYRTTSDVASELSQYVERTGVLPTSLEEVRAAVRRVRPGTQVEFAGVVDRSFCIRVGVDVGEQHPEDPHYSALVHTRPPGSHHWSPSQLQIGNSCSF